MMDTSDYGAPVFVGRFMLRRHIKHHAMKTYGGF